MKALSVAVVLALAGCGNATSSDINAVASVDNSPRTALSDDGEFLQPPSDEGESIQQCVAASDNGKGTLFITDPAPGAILADDLVRIEAECRDPGSALALLVNGAVGGVADVGEPLEWDLRGLPDGEIELVLLEGKEEGPVEESDPITVTVARGTTADDLAPLTLAGPPDGDMLFGSVTFTIDNMNGRDVELVFGQDLVVADFNADGLAVADTTRLEDGVGEVFFARETSNLIESNRLYYLVGNNIDTNGDGVRDYEEDYDGDGLTLAEEQAVGTSWISPDTDEDGLPDGAELANGFDPLNPDSDGDGILDGNER